MGEVVGRPPVAAAGPPRPRAPVQCEADGDLRADPGDGVDAGRDQRALVDQLQQALKSRSAIGQALGILMSQDGLTAEEALERLRVSSQDHNRKLREIAADVVAGGSGDVVGADRVEAVVQTRETVARAQGILMERYRLTGPAALTRLHADARQAGGSVSDVARRLVETGAESDVPATEDGR